MFAKYVESAPPTRMEVCVNFVSFSFLSLNKLIGVDSAFLSLAFNVMVEGIQIGHQRRLNVSHVHSSTSVGCYVCYPTALPQGVMYQLQRSITGILAFLT